MDVVGGKKDASIDDSFDLIIPKIIMKANAVNKALAFMFFLDFRLRLLFVTDCLYRIHACGFLRREITEPNADDCADCKGNEDGPKRDAGWKTELGT